MALIQGARKGEASKMRNDGVEFGWAKHCYA
jgi:hypothetical protein